jgi:hypothetical protein
LFLEHTLVQLGNESNRGSKLQSVAIFGLRKIWLSVGADFSFDVPSFGTVYLSNQVEPNLDTLRKVVVLIYLYNTVELV